MQALPDPWQSGDLNTITEELMYSAGEALTELPNGQKYISVSIENRQARRRRREGKAPQARNQVAC